MSQGLDSLKVALADRYEIERELGQGGMATVYLAKDPKHGRQVAIKVLKPELAAVIGAERFLTEIRVTANLQHPHILPLFDSGQANSSLYYVMPYVQGETLRARLDREKQLPVEDAVRIAADVADALDHAHERGVIHRDIKPANILLQDGRALVADFGVALAVSAAGGDRLTETGTSLGTPHYMSPEQASAETAITGRSDLYSLGAVLYEMLTGAPPHTGATSQIVLTHILTDTPRPVAEVRRSVPPNVADVVAKTLEKVPADRFGRGAEIASALADSTFRSSSRADHPPTPRRAVLISVGLATVMTAVAVWGWLPTSAPTSEGRIFAVGLPNLPAIDEVILSPTGDNLVIEADGQLWVEPLDGASSGRWLPRTLGGHNPFWSPDGRWIGYFQGLDVLKVPVEGGEPEPITTIGHFCAWQGCGGSWGRDGRVLVSTGVGEIFSAPEGGGAAELFIEPSEGEHFHRMVALPGGAVVMVVDPDEADTRLEIWHQGVRRTIGVGDYPTYAPEGFILYESRGDVWAVEYEAGDPMSLGEPFLVVADAARPSVSGDGTLLAARMAETDLDIVWVDRAGHLREPVVTGDGRAADPTRSVDGSRIAYVEAGRIWVYVPARRSARPLERDVGLQESPAWSPDGRRIFYRTAVEGEDDVEEGMIHSQDLSSNVVRPIVERARAPSVSRDGRLLVFTTGRTESSEVWYLSLDDDSAEPRPFLGGTSGSTGNALLSPTASLVAYVHGESDTGPEIWVSRFPGGDGRTQLSRGQMRYQTEMAWSGDGTRLYYRRHADGALMEVAVEDGERLVFGVPEPLFDELDSGLRLDLGFDVNEDGTRFLIVREITARGASRSGPILIQNWLAHAR